MRASRPHLARPAARAAVAAVALLAAVVASSPTRAAVPSAEKIARAVAEANRLSGRAVPVLADVRLSVGDGEPAATGVLASHPTGLARLELHSNKGFVERHLLQGNAHSASRDGQLLSRPHPFLPPIFLLQATSGAALRAALGSFGVAAGEVVLGRADDRDCYVFGGRLPRGPDGQERRVASLWVDVDSFEIVQIDRPDGVRFRFGPSADFEGIRAPSWIEVQSPERPRVRLDVERVAAANAPAAAFQAHWLSAETPEKP